MHRVVRFTFAPPRGLLVGLVAGGIALALAPAFTAEKAMPAEVVQAFVVPSSRSFGRLPDGREARLYTLEVPGG